MPQDIERGRLQQLQASGALVVEVLPHEEFTNEHLPGAINVPLAELGLESTQRLDKQRAVVVYCQASD